MQHLIIYERDLIVTELVPPKQHILLQAARVKFIVFQYSLNACDGNLSPLVVMGCDALAVFTSEGETLLERDKDVQ